MSGNYDFICPLCDQRYGANSEMDVYDDECDDTICVHCKDELNAERRTIAESGD